VDAIHTLSEDEIRVATRIFLAATDVVAEPSGAITLAYALFHTRELPRSAKVVAIVSGGNIDPKLRETLEAELATA
jgi:threonine dehydratase